MEPWVGTVSINERFIFSILYPLRTRNPGLASVQNNEGLYQQPPYGKQGWAGSKQLYKYLVLSKGIRTRKLVSFQFDPFRHILKNMKYPKSQVHEA